MIYTRCCTEMPIMPTSGVSQKLEWHTMLCINVLIYNESNIQSPYIECISLLSVRTITGYCTSNLIAAINVKLLQPLKLVRSSKVPAKDCTYCPSRSNLNRIFFILREILHKHQYTSIFHHRKPSHTRKLLLYCIHWFLLFRFLPSPVISGKVHSSPDESSISVSLWYHCCLRSSVETPHTPSIPEMSVLLTE